HECCLPSGKIVLLASLKQILRSRRSQPGSRDRGQRCLIRSPDRSHRGGRPTHRRRVCRYLLSPHASFFSLCVTTRSMFVLYRMAATRSSKVDPFKSMDDSSKMPVTKPTKPARYVIAITLKTFEPKSSLG